MEPDPGYSRGHEGLGYTLVTVGRFEEGLRALGQAANLEPLGSIVANHIGQAYLWMKKDREACEALRGLLEVDPGFFLARINLGKVHALNGRYQEAIREFERAISDSGENPLGPLADYNVRYQRSLLRPFLLRQRSTPYRSSRRRMNFEVPPYWYPRRSHVSNRQ